MLPNFPARCKRRDSSRRDTRVPLDAAAPALAGCSKRPSSKAAASEEVNRTLRYVEPLSDARTPLAGVFSIRLFADDFHQDPFTPAPIELAVKDLFPGAKIQLAVRNGHHNLAAHHLPLQVGVSIVFACLVMPIYCSVGSEPLEKFIIVAQQTLLIVVDIDTRRDMHGVHQDQTFPHSALRNRRCNLRRDVEIRPL